MKQVTVYTLDEKKVLVHGYQEVVEKYSMGVGDISPIQNSDEFIDKRQLEVEKIQLPIRLYRTIDKEDLYVAWDPSVLKLLGIEEEQVEAKLFSKNRHVNFLESELERIHNVSAWETVKVAWAKLWSKT